MKIATKPVSMDAPLTTDEESISLYDVYIAPDPSIQAPESSLNQDSLKTDIERSFAALSVREATNFKYVLWPERIFLDVTRRKSERN